MSGVYGFHGNLILSALEEFGDVEDLRPFPSIPLAVAFAGLLLALWPDQSTVGSLSGALFMVAAGLGWVAGRPRLRRTKFVFGDAFVDRSLLDELVAAGLLGWFEFVSKGRQSAYFLAWIMATGR